MERGTPIVNKMDRKKSDAPALNERQKEGAAAEPKGWLEEKAENKAKTSQHSRPKKIFKIGAETGKA